VGGESYRTLYGHATVWTTDPAYRTIFKLDEKDRNASTSPAD
jgi:hypothetical protein